MTIYRKNVIITFKHTVFRKSLLLFGKILVNYSLKDKQKILDYSIIRMIDNLSYFSNENEQEARLIQYSVI